MTADELETFREAINSRHPEKQINVSHEFTIGPVTRW
jgi:hypothetical protein